MEGDKGQTSINKQSLLSLCHQNPPHQQWRRILAYARNKSSTEVGYDLEGRRGRERGEGRRRRGRVACLFQV